jgi:hypothetical protein
METGAVLKENNSTGKIKTELRFDMGYLIGWAKKRHYGAQPDINNAPPVIGWLPRLFFS